MGEQIRTPHAHSDGRLANLVKSLGARLAKSTARADERLVLAEGLDDGARTRAVCAVVEELTGQSVYDSTS